MSIWIYRLIKYRNTYEIMEKAGVRFLRKLILGMVTYTSVSDMMVN